MERPDFPWGRNGALWQMYCILYKKYGTDPLKQVLGLLVDPARIVGSIHSDGLKQLVLIISMERRLTHQHFIQQHPKWPPINREWVFLSQQDLCWNMILWIRIIRDRQKIYFTPRERLYIWTTLPLERYSQGYHRKLWHDSLQTRSPCTCRSQRSLCVPHDPASHCLTSDLWKQNNHTTTAGLEIKHKQFLR